MAEKMKKLSLPEKGIEIDLILISKGKTKIGCEKFLETGRETYGFAVGFFLFLSFFVFFLVLRIFKSYLKTKTVRFFLSDLIILTFFLAVSLMFYRLMIDAHGQFRKWQQLSHLYSGVPENERQPKTIFFSKSFYLSKTEITRRQFFSVMQEKKYLKDDSNFPITNLTLEEVGRFFENLSIGFKGVFRLPTELEWEYGCRGNSNANFFGHGDEISSLGDYCWFSKNSNYQLHAVGELKPNSWGLFDMHGNAEELVENGYFDYSEISDNSIYEMIFPKLRFSKRIIIRGGSFKYSFSSCCTNTRQFVSTENQDDIGFRCLMEIEKDF